MSTMLHFLFMQVVVDLLVKIAQHLYDRPASEAEVGASLGRVQKFFAMLNMEIEHHVRSGE